MKKILIVDDSAFQRKILGEMITSLGYEVSRAPSGEAMLDLIEKEQFDCICLDLLMPGMSGIEIMEHVKDHENIPPIVIISADIQLTKKQQCLDLGAAGFINKAVNEQEVEELLGSLFKD